MKGRNRLADDLRAALLREVTNAPRWPNVKYADHPVDFARDVCGFECWSRQVEILNALAVHDYVTVRSGHRVGKTGIAGIAALWWFATRPKARVFLTAPSAKQIHEVTWREVRERWLAATEREVRGIVGAVALDGNLALRHDTGLVAPDGRQVTGIAPENDVRFQGLAGENLLFIAEEASGIPDPIFVAILANLAGGGKLFMIGNPNYSKGYFYDSFKNEGFKRFHVPSTASPLVTGEVSGAAAKRLRGLATPQWIRDRAQDWGAPDGRLWRIRVLGEFVENEEGRLFPPDMIAEAERIWASTPATGQLVIGIDPAGPSGSGDESAFACRRGNKITRLHARRGVTEDGHVIEALGLIKEEGAPGVAIVVVDTDGEVGWNVYGAFARYLVTHPDAYRLIQMRGRRSETAQRLPHVYNTMRDELWFGAREAFREGLAIPEDVKLAAELAEVRAEQTLMNRETVTPKDDLRAALGRSPDRADAVTLACWRPDNYAERAFIAQRENVDRAAQNRRVPQMDPYATGTPMGDRPDMDPYRGM